MISSWQLYQNTHVNPIPQSIYPHKQKKYTHMHKQRPWDCTDVSANFKSYSLYADPTPLPLNSYAPTPAKEP